MIKDPVTNEYTYPVHTPKEEAMRLRVIHENCVYRARTLLCNVSVANKLLELDVTRMSEGYRASAKEHSVELAARNKWLEEVEEAEYKRINALARRKQ